MIVWKDKFVTVTTGTAVEPRYFGMFTDEGNNAVAFIVDYHRANKNAWEKAKELKFYIGFRNCNSKFLIDNIIKNIKNPDIFI